MHILVIHGPNLNLLGEREPEIYGDMTLEQLNLEITQYAWKKGIQVECFQSNHEGAIIDFIHENRKSADGIIINPGALTHYSYALHDALKSVDVPAVEVHLSDIHSREDFRSISVTAPACIAQISGKGKMGYLEAIATLVRHLEVF
ncbi:type II 3-dehydroquinate dehydratase [bacterium]|nr:type II 3-dehydroquinate dehydratase [bacterium]